MLRWQESSLSASGNNPTGRENLNPRVSNSKGLDLTSFAVPPSQLRSKTKLKSPWGVCKGAFAHTDKGLSLNLATVKS